MSNNQADSETWIWVFNGRHHHFPSAVFSSREKAEEWIYEHEIEGTLTAYPLDKSACDRAVEQRYFTPKKPEHTPEHTEDTFMGNFSHASQPHEHYRKEHFKEHFEERTRDAHDDDDSLPDESANIIMSGPTLPAL